MPLYNIEHIILLTDEQQLALANALTKAHTDRFHTPTYFINVHFTDVNDMKVFHSRRLVKPQNGIHAVWILGALSAGMEAGFPRPLVGEEHEWLVKHKAEFQRLADQGNQDFASLIKELAEREDFKDI
ncbi:hypothetical protein B7463_g4791, partial [Scytalidium lignicola]